MEFKVGVCFLVFTYVTRTRIKRGKSIITGRVMGTHRERNRDRERDRQTETETERDRDRDSHLVELVHRCASVVA